MEHFDQTRHHAGRHGHPTQLAGSLLASRRTKDPTSRIDHEREGCHLGFEYLEETRPLLADLPQVQRGIQGGRLEVAKGQIEDVLGCIETPLPDQASALNQGALADRVIEQENVVFGRIAGSGKQVDDPMDVAQQRPPQPTRAAHQRFVSSSALLDAAPMCSLWIKTLVVAGHKGHLPKGETGVVPVMWTRQVHLHRPPTTVGQDEGIPRTQELRRHLAILDPFGQMGQVLEIGPVQESGQAKQGDPHLDDDVTRKAQLKLLGKGFFLGRHRADHKIDRPQGDEGGHKHGHRYAEGLCHGCDEIRPLKFVER